MNKNIAITAVVSTVVGGIAGGAITYLTVNRALRTRYEDWANAEINDVKARYAQMNEERKGKTLLEMAENPSPEMQKLVEQGKKIMESMNYGREESGEEVHPSAQTLSIWDQAVPEPDEDDEEPADVPYGDEYEVIEGEPFLISEGEYFENEPEYELDTLTYFVVDDTLTDDKNTQIDRVEETIGTRHLHMFPKPKGNQKTSLYIRNDEHQTLYEVIMVEQSYAAVVLGVDPEELGLKEPKKKPKKMPKDGD